MTKNANATYSVAKWRRQPWTDKQPDEGSGWHLARVEMTHIFEGDIVGEGIIQYLFADNVDGHGSFVALEKVIGSIHGKSGSFVLQHVGTFSSGQLKKTSTVVLDSGTDELDGLQGQAIFEGDQHQEQYTIHLTYNLNLG